MMNQKGNCCIPGTSTLFIYFVILAILLGLVVYIKGGQSQPVPKQLSVLQEDLEVIRGKHTPPLDLDKAYMASETVIARGKELYQGGTCVGCHGTDGRGDGAAGQFMNPKPRNFHSQEGWTNGSKIADIFRALTDGIPERGMPAIDTISVQDRFALVHYVRSLGSGYPAPDESEKKELDRRYQLSKGQQEPHQVPVSRAIAVIAKESAEAKVAVEKAVAVIEADSSKNHPTARMFTSSVRNLNHAITILNANKLWRRGAAEMRSFWMANTGVQGLSTAVTTLEDRDWRELHSYMLDIL